MTPSKQQTTQTKFAISNSLIAVLLFVLALMPRVLAPGDFWTADEAKHWSVRVDTFLPAIQEGNYAATNLVGHPGVTTMWAGSLGVLMHQGLASLGIVAPDDPFLYRMFLRVPIAIITSMAIGLAYILLCQLLNRRIALVAAFLWITDPFLVAHSKVLHVDALLTFFTFLSMLAAMCAFGLGKKSYQSSQKSRDHKETVSTLRQAKTTQPLPLSIRWSMLLLSAIMGGLALLTKSPSLILFPMTALISMGGIGLQLVRTWNNTQQETDRQSHIPLFAYVRSNAFVVIRTWIIALVLWGMAAMGTWIALWPAAWIDPIGSAMTVINEIFRNGAAPHGWGNFFFGQVVKDPGPLFYPVAIDLRLTPWSMAGLLVAGGVALWRLGMFRRAVTEQSIARYTPTKQKQEGEGNTAFPALTLLLIFALTFTAIMSILAKKFDRYVLPIFPILDIVAAMGLLWFSDGLQRWTNTPENKSNNQEQPHIPRVAVPILLWGIVVVGLTINLVWYHPYEMAYYNQALGGGTVAERTIYTGWGEGLEKAAAYINKQYNGCDLGVASWYEYVILPYTCSPVLHQGYISVPGHVHYAVLYINQVQRQIRMNEIRPQLEERGALVHTVKMYGIEYAYVYQLRQPRQYTITADFGESLRLTGYDVDRSDIATSSVLTLTLQWQARQPMTTDYNMFIHVFDAAGNPVGQVDVPPGGLLPTTTWGRNHFIDWVHRVPVPPEVADQPLWITLGIYDPDTFARLPLHNAPLPPPDAPDDGANALVLRIGQ